MNSQPDGRFGTITAREFQSAADHFLFHRSDGFLQRATGSKGEGVEVGVAELLTLGERDPFGTDFAGQIGRGKASIRGTSSRHTRPRCGGSRTFAGPVVRGEGLEEFFVEGKRRAGACRSDGNEMPGQVADIFLALG